MKGKKTKFVVGVDVSKEWFHWAIVNVRNELIQQGEGENTSAGVKGFINQLLLLLMKEDLSGILLVMEHTGIYCNHLSSVWSASGGKYSVVPAVQISSALAGPLGWDHKTDAIDAGRIAEYGVRFEDKLALSEPKPLTLTKLRKLKTQRKRLQDSANRLVVSLKEESGFESAELVAELNSLQADAVSALKKSIEAVEQRIQDTISEDPQLAYYYKLINSVPGVGPVIAVEVLVVTEGFTLFTPSQASSFKRYARVAPMPKQSGKKKRKMKTTKRGSKKLNALLTMGAVTLIRSTGELTDYYYRKIAEGKHPQSVINAMKGKLIDRMFAVVRNDNMYQKNLNVN